MHLTHSILWGLAICLFGSCSGTKSGAQTKDNTAVHQNNGHIIQGELIVQLANNSTPQELEATFTKYQLKLKNPVAKSMNMWLFEFDTSSIENEKLIKLLKKSDFVKEAESNKKLELRN